MYNVCVQNENDFIMTLIMHQLTKLVFQLSETRILPCCTRLCNNFFILLMAHIY